MSEKDLTIRTLVRQVIQLPDEAGTSDSFDRNIGVASPSPLPKVTRITRSKSAKGQKTRKSSANESFTPRTLVRKAIDVLKDAPDTGYKRPTRSTPKTTPKTSYDAHRGSSKRTQKTLNIPFETLLEDDETRTKEPPSSTRVRRSSRKKKLDALQELTKGIKGIQPEHKQQTGDEDETVQQLNENTEKRKSRKKVFNMKEFAEGVNSWMRSASHTEEKGLTPDNSEDQLFSDEHEKSPTENEPQHAKPLQRSPRKTASPIRTEEFLREQQSPKKTASSKRTGEFLRNQASLESRSSSSKHHTSPKDQAQLTMTKSVSTGSPQRRISASHSVSPTKEDSHAAPLNITPRQKLSFTTHRSPSVKSTPRQNQTFTTRRRSTIKSTPRQNQTFTTRRSSMVKSTPRQNQTFISRRSTSVKLTPRQNRTFTPDKSPSVKSTPRENQTFTMQRSTGEDSSVKISNLRSLSPKQMRFKNNSVNQEASPVLNRRSAGTARGTKGDESRRATNEPTKADKENSDLEQVDNEQTDLSDDSELENMPTRGSPNINKSPRSPSPKRKPQSATKQTTPRKHTTPSLSSPQQASKSIISEKRSKISSDTLASQSTVSVATAAMEVKSPRQGSSSPVKEKSFRRSVHDDDDDDDGEHTSRQRPSLEKRYSSQTPRSFRDRSENVVSQSSSSETPSSPRHDRIGLSHEGRRSSFRGATDGSPKHNVSKLLSAGKQKRETSFANRSKDQLVKHTDAQTAFTSQRSLRKRSLVFDRSVEHSGLTLSPKDKRVSLNRDETRLSARGAENASPIVRTPLGQSQKSIFLGSSNRSKRRPEAMHDEKNNQQSASSPEKSVTRHSLEFDETPGPSGMSRTPRGQPHETTFKGTSRKSNRELQTDQSPGNAFAMERSIGRDLSVLDGTGNKREGRKSQGPVGRSHRESDYHADDEIGDDDIMQSEISDDTEDEHDHAEFDIDDDYLIKDQHVETDVDDSEFEDVLEDEEVFEERRPRKKEVDPDKYMKDFATERFGFRAQYPVHKDCKPIIFSGVQKFMKQVCSEVQAFAHHANRKSVKPEDVTLFMKRYGYITDTQSLDFLIVKYFPLPWQIKLMKHA